MRICRKLLCCPFVWGSYWEPCHRVAYGIQPARTHLYDRSLLLCGCCQLNQSCLGTENCWVGNRYGLTAWTRRHQTREIRQLWQQFKMCRYVFTPMLSGLRWPGQTVIGSWPPAVMLELVALFSLRNRGGHTHTRMWRMLAAAGRLVSTYLPTGRILVFKSSCPQKVRIIFFVR